MDAVERRAQQIATLRGLADLLTEHPELDVEHLNIQGDGRSVSAHTTIGSIQAWAAVVSCRIDVYGGVRSDDTAWIQAAAHGRLRAPLTGQYMSVIAPTGCGLLGNAHDHDRCIADVRDRVGGGAA